MAEITISAQGSLSNGSLQDSIPLLQLSITQTVADMYQRVATIPTSDTAIPLTITTPGWAYLQNLDDTNYLQYGPASAGAIVVFGKLKPGEYTVLRLDPTIALRAIAHTASCKLLVKVWND